MLSRWRRLRPSDDGPGWSNCHDIGTRRPAPRPNVGSAHTAQRASVCGCAAFIRASVPAAASHVAGPNRHSSHRMGPAHLLCVAPVCVFSSACPCELVRVGLSERTALPLRACAHSSNPPRHAPRGLTIRRGFDAALSRGPRPIGSRQLPAYLPRAISSPAFADRPLPVGVRAGVIEGFTARFAQGTPLWSLAHRFDSTPSHLLIGYSYFGQDMTSVGGANGARQLNRMVTLHRTRRPGLGPGLGLELGLRSALLTLSIAPHSDVTDSTDLPLSHIVRLLLLPLRCARQCGG